MFKTKDFYQAVILKTYGFKLIEIERKKIKFVVFVFDDSDNKAEEVIANYWNHHLKLEVRDFVENISELKSRIYSGV